MTVASSRIAVRRAADTLRNRALWMLLGLVLGGLASFGLQAFALNGRLVALETEVKGLRRDLDKLKP